MGCKNISNDWETTNQIFTSDVKQSLRESKLEKKETRIFYAKARLVLSGA